MSNANIKALPRVQVSSGLKVPPTTRQLERAIKSNIYDVDFRTNHASGETYAYLRLGTRADTYDLVGRTDISIGKHALTFKLYSPASDGLGASGDASGDPASVSYTSLDEDATPSPAKVMIASYATTASASIIDTPTRQRVIKQARRLGVILHDSTRPRFSLPASLPSTSSLPAAAIPRDGRRHTAPTPSRYVRDRTPPSSRRSSSASSGFDFACVGSPQNTQGLFGPVAATADRATTPPSPDRGEDSSNGLYYVESPPSRVIDGLTPAITTFSEKFDGIDCKVHGLELAHDLGLAQVMSKQNDELRVELGGLRNAVETSQGRYEALELEYRHLGTKMDDLAEHNATLIDAADELRVDKEDAERALIQERAEYRELNERLLRQNTWLSDRLQVCEAQLRALEAPKSKKKASARSGFGADITNVFGTPAPASGSFWRRTSKRARAAGENELVERDANRRRQMSRE